MAFDFRLSGNTLKIPSINFIGRCATSPNGRFVLGWQDADYRGMGSGYYRGGFRKSGHGRVVLLRDGEFHWECDLERPNDGAVANTGHVVVNDWGFGLTPRGKFWAFDSEGHTILCESFRSTIFSIGITEDGSVAYCTGSTVKPGPGTERLFVYSTQNHSLLFNSPLHPWRIIGITNRGAEIAITTQYERLNYSLDGTILGSGEFLAEGVTKTLESNRLEELLFVARHFLDESRVGSLSSESRELLMQVLSKIASEGNSPDYREAAERELGEIAFRRGDKLTALAHLRNAITLNPKVGVKRLISQLEKNLGRLPTSEPEAK